MDANGGAVRAVAFFRLWRTPEQIRRLARRGYDRRAAERGVLPGEALDGTLSRGPSRVAPLFDMQAESP